MKGIEVELMDVMGDDLSTVNAARVSFNKMKDEFDGSDERLVKYLADHRHMCYDDKTEVFTCNGWKLFKDLVEEDLVASVYGWEEDNFKFKFVKPEAVLSFDHDGEMIKVESDYVSYSVTPSHKMLYMSRDSKGLKGYWEISDSDEVYGKFKRYRTTATLDSDYNREEYLEGCLHGFVLGDGFRPVDTENKTYVRLKRPRKIKYLTDLLEESGRNYQVSVSNQGVTKFSIEYNQDIYDKSRTKHVSLPFLRDKGLSYCKGVFDGLLNSDGSTKRKTHTFSSTSRSLVDALIYCGTLCGKNVVENKSFQKEKPNYELCYRVMVQTRDSATVNKDNSHSYEFKERYKGLVYCATVETGMLLVRRDGRQMVCGNTPFRHNQIQLRCKAPIFIARQLGKHQAGLSWNEVSRRYVDSEPELFETVHRKRPEGGIKQGSSGSADELPAFKIGDESYTISDFHDAILNWYSEATDEEGEYKISPETARAELPQSMITEWVWSGNLLAFAHVYKERIASGAQLEAREFAKALDEIIRPLFPVSWSALVD